MSNVTKPIILNETGEQIVQKLSEIASSNKSFELLLDTKADKTSVSTPYNFKGSTTYDALPTSNNNVNDTYYCTDVKCKYTWNGSGWFQSSLSEVDYTDEISKLSNEIVDSNDGNETLSTSFVLGNLNENGALDTGVVSRVSSKDFLQYEREIVLEMTQGYKYIILIYNSDYSLKERTIYHGYGFIKIPANAIFKITILSNDEIPDVEVDVNNYASKIKLLNRFNNRIKNMVSEANNGKEQICGSFVLGNLKEDGVLDNTPSRVSTENYLSYDNDVIIDVDEGYTCIICLYNDDLTLLERYDYKTKNTIPKNTLFRMTILKIPHNPSDTPNIMEYASKAGVSSSINERLKTIEAKENCYYGNLMQIFPSFVVIGDSLACGYTAVGDVFVDSATAKPTGNNWVGYLQTRTGRTFNNIAIGGSSVQDWRNTHISNADIDTNCYLIGLGVNDIRKGLTIGTTNDITSDYNNNADSFYGNMDYIINKLKEYNGNSHIFIFTIPASEGGNTNNYNEAIRYICGLYENVHCIDLYNIYPTEYTSGIIANSFIGGHYYPLVYNYMSNMIEKAICNYMYSNYELFQEVPYN